MKRFVAGGLTIAIMGLLLWAGARRPEPVPSSAEPGTVEAPPNPASGAEARIQKLLEDSARGDVSAYLAGFGGPLRERLEREMAERGRDAFAGDLKRAAAARKSHATFAPETEGADAARVTVETVYPDRNERQTYRLEQGPDGWLVMDVETVRSHQPKAKYGSPASYQEPEGPPVQPGLTVETGEEN
ncbi:MAG: hypothetical protein P4L84_24630 [Isosphaeraceae bacterium]|nr:hypothetical protein [Isosphaeraceae bacterium]